MEACKVKINAPSYVLQDFNHEMFHSSLVYELNKCRFQLLSCFIFFRDRMLEGNVFCIGLPISGMGR